MTLPSQFFTTESFTTLLGCVSIVFIITNTLQSVFNFKPRWLVLGVSLAITTLGVALSEHQSFFQYFLGFLNGCIVYLTAVGTNTVFNRESKRREEISIDIIQQERDNHRFFFQNWND